MTVLYGIFPPLMFWRARQQAKAAEEGPPALEKPEPVGQARRWLPHSPAWLLAHSPSSSAR